MTAPQTQQDDWVEPFIIAVSEAKSEGRTLDPDALRSLLKAAPFTFAGIAQAQIETLSADYDDCNTERRVWKRRALVAEAELADAHNTNRGLTVRAESAEAALKQAGGAVAEGCHAIEHRPLDEDGTEPMICTVEPDGSVTWYEGMGPEDLLRNVHRLHPNSQGFARLVLAHAALREELSGLANRADGLEDHWRKAQAERDEAQASARFWAAEDAQHAEACETIRADGVKQRDAAYAEAAPAWRFVSWAFQACVVDGGNLDGSEVQEALAQNGLSEELPVDPETNEWGEGRLWFLTEASKAAMRRAEQGIARKLVEGK